MYLSRLEEDILALDTKLTYSNLTRVEREALKSLQNDTSIVIKEADKGSAVVIWDREDYLIEASNQLKDNSTYQLIEGDDINPLVNTIKTCLTKIQKRGDISNETLDYFLVDNPRIGRFYLLPKIHKRLNSIPGRPVISNCGYFTENISSFLDFHLKPLAQNVKSYIKDTTDFLKKLRGLSELPEDCLLCTIDVVGLYPNIPHEEGLVALKKTLENQKFEAVSQESIIELTDCVLKNNIFEHNNKKYRQIQGTAIGTKMAPSYAIIFMGNLEETFLSKCSLKPSVWWRYIDDIFMIWEHGEENLKTFLNDLNNFHNTIKFTSDYSSEKINFLDVQVIKKENFLATDLFIKPTDTHQYLEASSCHVYHTKKAIPYSQTLRLNKICSELEYFNERCDQLEEWLERRGYNGKMVRQQVSRGRKLNRDFLLDNKAQTREIPDLVFNITYHPAFSEIKSILSNIHLLLTPNEEHRSVFSSIPVVGFKRGRSLKDLLVRAKLPNVFNRRGQSSGCGGKRCQVCNMLKTTDSFNDRDGQRKFLIKSDLNCNSTNVVYLAQCKKCGIQYVGSSTTKFRMRFNNYKTCYRKFDLNQSVPQSSFHAHFAQEDHQGMDDWDFILIDQGTNTDSTRRKERFWQYTLDTFHPEGLNEREVVMDYG